MARVAQLVRRIGALWAVVALAAGATPATATRWTVDHAGSGDFTTIQAALDQQAMEFRDTVLVMPGVYAETLLVRRNGVDWVVRGALGAAATAAVSIGLTESQYSQTGAVQVEGLAFTGPVASPEGADHWRFRSCTFLGTVQAYGGTSNAPNFEDCDFYDRTEFESFIVHHGLFGNLRFHQAPLVVRAGGIGPAGFRNCTFEGPADTLVYARGGGDGVKFEDCGFSAAGIGVLCADDGMSFGGYLLKRCRFADISDVAITLSESGLGGGLSETQALVVDSRFERCGTAVRWISLSQLGSIGASLSRDTVLASTGNAVELGLHAGDVFDCVIDGGDGHGVEFRHVLAPGAGPLYSGTVSGCTIVNNAGDGVRVTNTATELPARDWWRYTVTNCTLAHNQGAGLRAAWPYWDVRNCVSYANGDDGFCLETTLGGRPNRLQSNTSAFNQGDGFRLTFGDPAGDSLLLAQHNLATMNSGAGFRTPSGFSGSYAFNDAWGNYQGQHVGAWASLDSNLTVDPRFCDLGAGDLTLEQGSPCGPGGVYGLIGALPESCPNTLAVEPQPAGAVAFAVRPSVARGSVEFVPPATGGEGVVELFDLAGRVVWRAPLGPQTGTVRWHGEGEGGRVRAGLYWARFTNDAGPATRRLAWLE